MRASRMHNSNRQFNLWHLFLCVTAFALSFGLYAAALALSSAICTMAAILVFGTSIGGTIGLLLGGKGGAANGGLVGLVVAFYVILLLPVL